MLPCFECVISTVAGLWRRPAQWTTLLGIHTIYLWIWAATVISFWSIECGEVNGVLHMRQIMRSLAASIQDSLQCLFWGKPCKEPWDHHAVRKPTSPEEAVWRQSCSGSLQLCHRPQLWMEEPCWTTSLVKLSDEPTPQHQLTAAISKTPSETEPWKF